MEIFLACCTQPRHQANRTRFSATGSLNFVPNDLFKIDERLQPHTFLCLCLSPLAAFWPELRLPWKLAWTNAIITVSLCGSQEC